MARGNWFVVFWYFMIIAIRIQMAGYWIQINIDGAAFSFRLKRILRQFH